MLNILWMIILIIILFIIILLLIGIKISLTYEKRGAKLNGCLKILILKKIKVFSKEYPPSDEDEKKVEEDDDDEDNEIDIKKLYKLAKPCFEDFKQYLSSVFNIISIKRMDNHLIFGMDSFADTGKYIGIIWAVLATVNSMHKKLRFSAEPSFEGSVLDGYGVNEVEIYPLKLIVPTTRLLLNKNVRDFIRGVLDER